IQNSDRSRQSEGDWQNPRPLVGQNRLSGVATDFDVEVLANKPELRRSSDRGDYPRPGSARSANIRSRSKEQENGCMPHGCAHHSEATMNDKSRVINDPTRVEMSVTPLPLSEKDEDQSGGDNHCIHFGFVAGVLMDPAQGYQSSRSQQKS